MEPLTEIQMLAVAVLRGDKAAERGLLDALVENYSQGLIFPPFKRIQVDGSKVSAVFYVKEGDDYEVDRHSIKQQIEEWLDNPGTHIVLEGIERMELYEFPQKQEPKKRTKK